MSTPRTARQIAEHMIRSAVEEIEFMSIGEVGELAVDDLADDEDAFDKVRTEVDDLIPKAVITVTWPESEADHG